jgi:OmpA-OmpF porin, OOP family
MVKVRSARIGRARRGRLAPGRAWRLVIPLAGLLMAAGAPASAQTIGFAQAIDRLAAGCGQDIDRFCSKVNLGGGRVEACLSQNEARVSARCRSTWAEVKVSLQRRTSARTSLVRACDADRRQLCAGVEPGDANLIDCLAMARRRVSQSCNQAITDAGYWDR